jgi:outer membrane protein OmpA-like peptidoglycan-associated protein
MSVRTVGCWLIVSGMLVAPAAAQSGSEATRPARPTFYGDTGLWFVPTAETLPARKVATSLFFAHLERPQGATDVNEFGLTTAVGLTDRVEVFAQWSVVRLRRVVRDPFFDTGNRHYGGVDLAHPSLTTPWSKTMGGPVTLGTKLNLMSQSRDDTMAMAARAMIEFPVGPSASGTGAIVGRLELVASREIAERVEVTGSVGGLFRRDPKRVDRDNFNLPNTGIWGVGVQFPTRSKLRAVVDLEGGWAVPDRLMVVNGPLVADDGSIAPVNSFPHEPINFKAGAIWQMSRGPFVHGGVSYTSDTENRTVGGRQRSHTGWGMDVSVGFHPGTKVYVAPVSAPPPARPVAAAPPAPAPANGSPTLGPIMCDPCTVETGKTSQLSVMASDPENNPLTYRWSAPIGTFSPADAASTVWTAPNQVGNVPVTVTVTDSNGGAATRIKTLQVVQPPVTTYSFEDVHFAFDMYTLRPDALRVLDDAATTLRENPDLRVTIEGHCDSTGTVEYNLALGDRRASAARTYLVDRGIAATRLEIVSYGEERPTADNATADGRAMNRRAALIVKLR